MKAPYYKHDGTATQRLLDKLNKKKELALIGVNLRSATGEDRKELMERREQLRQEIYQLDI